MEHFEINEAEEDLPIRANDDFGKVDAPELVSVFVVKEMEGTLSPKEIQKFKSHLLSCETCSEKYAVLRGFLRRLVLKCKSHSTAVGD